MAATVSPVFRVWARECYPSFPHFIGCACAVPGVLASCYVVRGKYWPLAFYVFCVYFNARFLYPAFPLKYFVLFLLQRYTILFRKGLALVLGCVRFSV
jgi:hypothetical protein